LAEEWGRKIRQYKTRLEQGKKVLAEKIIPYFKEVQQEIASEDFSVGATARGAENRFAGIFD
jgi:hypothetical protein